MQNMEQMQVEGHLLTVASSGKVVMQVAQLRGQIYNYCKCFQLVTKQIGSNLQSFIINASYRLREAINAKTSQSYEHFP